MSDLSTKSRLVLHGGALFFAILAVLVLLASAVNLSYMMATEEALAGNRAVQLYQLSGRTICHDQGNDWECRATTIKGKEVFVRGKLIQPEGAVK